MLSKTKRLLGIVLVLIIAVAIVPNVAVHNAYALEEGGYVYNRGESRFISNVYNFLKHFSYEQYYWAQYYMFTKYNDYYVDAMDFAYYSGHGNNWYIGMGPGAVSPRGVNLRYPGDGYGDNDLEFIVFQSCKVIPSPRDTSDWARPWYTAFNRLHQAMGYRTISYSGNGISNNFGSRIRANQMVWQAWFKAVNDERSWWRGSFYPGYACAIMHPTVKYDRYYNVYPDPPAGSTWFWIVYQY